MLSSLCLDHDIDNISAHIVGILSDRRKVHLLNYFLAYPLQTRKYVKSVGSDMFTPYMEIIPVLLLIIIDEKFKRFSTF